jgi:hypothetical protein
MESIRSKLSLKMYDEYVNVIRGMYSVRFNESTVHVNYRDVKSCSEFTSYYTLLPLSRANMCVVWY